MPYRRYREDLQRPDFRHDPAQERAIQRLQRVYDELVARPPAAPPSNGGGLLSRLFGREPPPSRPPVRGLYIWGGVGRGKTYLVDSFFEALPFPDKLRLHFHRFMQRVHHELKALHQRQQRDPLKVVADHLAAEARVLCLDEFIVTDITDAMLLAGLLQALFQRGVTLVSTSNIPPDELYKDGLQRARFLPAIALLKEHLEVLHMDGGIDYRLRYLEKAEIYHYPLDEQAERILEASFANLAPEPGTRGQELLVNERPIPTRRLADDVVWFDFVALCDGPRSQMDYIEIARCFHTVLLSGVPLLTALMDDQARRFINLVDEFYDRNVKLIVSAAAPHTQLYQGERLRFEFQRTASRLTEMQSRDYLARPHLP
ncbi:MAG TPA: cell division protein ZapE [Candidatus Competibacteraceae bacterium]|nr:cell division protein ZapE [Candidatus Competibacteraceae bacterium]